MEVAFLNSKVAMVKIPSAGFTGDQVELEKYAELIGQYGNIKSVDINRTPVYTLLTYNLDN